LPTEHDLMSIYDASRDTIRKSLAILLNEGYIFKQAGKGTFVRKVKSNYKLTLLESFSEQMRASNIEPSSEIIKIEKTKPEQYILNHLEANEEEKIFKIERLRKANNDPMCYEIAFVSESICNNIDKKVQDNISLYDLYENYYNLKLNYGDMTIEAKKAPKHISKVLKIKPHDAILEMRIVVYLDTGRPLYYVEAYYIGNKYFFSATLPRKA
ncbi:MAG: GntR family transcriptional regulator, partial [Clostridia bacterium]|nr:GntR family transcriptional regulator [Clostridia bacterium]